MSYWGGDTDYFCIIILDFFNTDFRFLVQDRRHVPDIKNKQAVFIQMLRSINESLFNIFIYYKITNYMEDC